MVFHWLLVLQWGTLELFLTWIYRLMHIWNRFLGLPSFTFVILLKSGTSCLRVMQKNCYMHLLLQDWTTVIVYYWACYNHQPIFCVGHFFHLFAHFLLSASVTNYLVSLTCSTPLLSRSSSLIHRQIVCYSDLISHSVPDSWLQFILFLFWTWL